MPDAGVAPETLTSDERDALAPYFTNLDGPVFALVNLPETVKGALFARYSRSPKSLRRLFLDEFLDKVVTGTPDSETSSSQCGHTHRASETREVQVAGAALSRAEREDARREEMPPRDTVREVGIARAEKLYARVFNEYGDDSVAQLGGVHLACEDVSNIATKVLEWGRLMAYLEQSTRYIPYTDLRGGRWRYVVPGELPAGPLRDRYTRTLDAAFEAYARWVDPMQAYYRARYPQGPGDSDFVYRQAIKAKALDTLRGMLPAATQANVGLFGTGQAYEAALLRMRKHPLGEVRELADLMLTELRKVIPAFLTRVDKPDRGGRWSEYLAETRRHTENVAEWLLSNVAAEARDEVTLTEWDPDGELKVVAAALYSASALPDDQLLAIARRMTGDDRLAVLKAYVGTRTNRRHKPGRAFERTAYRFDLLTDYGAFRDLQRHRLLTVEWQPLSTRHGFIEPEAIEEAGALDDWRRVMDGSADLYDALVAEGVELAAPYAVAMAYRVRYYMHMNAREAMHMIELRTTPQGHPSYRRVCQTMHRLIDERAGHHAIAAAMQFADHSSVELERLQAERIREQKRSAI